MKYKIIEVNVKELNYPYESLLPIPLLDQAQAEAICLILNGTAKKIENCSRSWKIVDENYFIGEVTYKRTF